MYSLGPGGVDVLGNLAGKMEQQLKETEQVRTSFDADIRMYKNKQISKKEFVHKLVTYTISISALNFLVMHVILEMRSALEKGTSMKDNTGGTVMEDSSVPGSQFSFGIEGFLGGSYQGGSADGGEIMTNDGFPSTYPVVNICKDNDTIDSYGGINYENGQKSKKEYSFRSTLPKHCVSCGRIQLRLTNFCGACGHKQYLIST